MLTNADGVFAFDPEKSATLLLAKDGFLPELVHTNSAESGGRINVVMRPETEPSLILPSCGQGRGEVFRELELAKRRSIRVTRGGDVDYICYSATYRAKGLTAVLGSSAGIYISGLAPSPEWLRGLSSLSLRSINCGGKQWIDLRGVSEGSGQESRWIGYAMSYVEYSNLPTEAARAFDIAIERGCCR